MRIIGAVVLAALAIATALPVAAAVEQDVQVDGGRAPLKGTLCLPDGDTPVPVVLILSDTYATNRDGNAPWGILIDTYKELAHDLALSGIGSLRVDMRGLSGSTPAKIELSEMRFERYIDDALLFGAWRRRTDRGTEGQRTRRHFKIGSTSVRGSETIRRLMRPKKADDPAYDEFLRILAELEAGRLVPDVPDEFALLLGPSGQPLMISWFKYDPRAEIAKVRSPVLIVQGTTDLEASVDDARALAAAKPDAGLLIIDGMNRTWRAGPAERWSTGPLHPALTPALASFIRR